MCSIPETIKSQIINVKSTFSLDANGIVSVTAKDLKNNKEQTITISNNDGLTEEEIQRMIEEAEKNKSQDEEKMKQIYELKNRAETYITSIEVSMKDANDKILAEQKA